MKYDIYYIDKLKRYLFNLKNFSKIKETVVARKNDKLNFYKDLGYVRIIQEVSQEEQKKIELEIELITNLINKLENE